MNRFKNRMQLKLLLQFLLSTGISVFVTMTLFIIFGIVVVGSYDDSISWINGHISYIPALFGIMGIMFVFILGGLFFMITRGSFTYLSQISKELNEISEGRLDIRIPVKSEDELGRLADDINNMTLKLKQSNEEEKRAENAKIELINNISHDLRTPLTSVIGYLNLLSEKKYSSEEDMEKFLGVAHNKALWINKLVGQLFEYSRLNSKDLELKIARINLVEIIEQLMVGFIPQLKTSDMEYSIKTTQNQFMVNGDGALISRLFENIINNAICYGKEGKYIEIDISSLSKKVYVSISDFGQEISKEHAEKIFDRMYRGDKSRHQNQAGAGLGLSIARSISKAHNGDIHFEVEGKKKTFKVDLPLADA